MAQHCWLKAFTLSGHACPLVCEEGYVAWIALVWRMSGWLTASVASWLAFGWDLNFSPTKDNLDMRRSSQPWKGRWGAKVNDPKDEKLSNLDDALLDVLGILAKLSRTYQFHVQAHKIYDIHWNLTLSAKTMLPGRPLKKKRCTIRSFWYTTTINISVSARYV